MLERGQRRVVVLVSRGEERPAAAAAASAGAGAAGRGREPRPVPRRPRLQRPGEVRGVTQVVLVRGGADARRVPDQFVRRGRHEVRTPDLVAPVLRLPVVHLLVPLQVRLVARRVVTEGADVVLLPAVHREVALQQRLPAEVAAAEPAHVAVAMENEHMVP